jgi:hypothetical protein
MLFPNDGGKRVSTTVIGMAVGLHEPLLSRGIANARLRVEALCFRIRRLGSWVKLTQGALILRAFHPMTMSAGLP